MSGKPECSIFNSPSPLQAFDGVRPLLGLGLGHGVLVGEEVFLPRGLFRAELLDPLDPYYALLLLGRLLRVEHEGYLQVRFL
jgi:hypothetical protein